MKNEEFKKSQMKKALISFVIEQSLIDAGDEIFEKTLKNLKKFDSDVNDCNQHPDYLIKSITEFPKKTREQILLSIAKKLEEFAYQPEINEFIKIICCKQ
ncbi:hypothetical protein [Nitrosopumilus adriaticus]|uniref:Uncharacterized protein n=1 Tax=Nitrosopumilus adriaticus TaxID=1580092 RepID=A0A0D5C2I3_9ARCH|nr:hypothetical protein [Nitrosopumilus adriaticus]AJW70617.1 hypothetical protein NADRNF5_0923 [Nitrosopumilus adriaticus]